MNPILVLFALVAIEKFGHNKENKIIIDSHFGNQLFHPLLPLDLHYGSENYLWRQVGFFARWSLDNTFEFMGRRFTFETQDMSKINAILNTKDISEYLKISSDGLEARSDSHSFETVRATFEISSGCWYYEAEIVTPGVMQIGWATNDSSFQNRESKLDGFGVGDDAFSIAYDGCRCLIWHNAQATPQSDDFRWRSGDILGCLIDIEHQEAVFSLNGRQLPSYSDIFNQTRISVDKETGSCSEGFYPASSLMAHQQCRFNFGATPFKFPPTDREFQIINDHGILTDKEKRVIPRRVLQENIQIEDCVDTSLCSVCYAFVGSFGVNPCEHDGFCQNCVVRLDACPLCRRPVESIYIVIL